MLRLERDDEGDGHGAPLLDLATAVLADLRSGLQVTPGALTAIVCTSRRPSMTSPAPRRIRAAGGATTVDGVPMATLDRRETRRTIVVQDRDPTLLSGTLAELFDVPRSGRASVADAVATASAADVLDAVADADADSAGALTARITERGRSTRAVSASASPWCAASSPTRRS